LVEPTAELRTELAERLALLENHRRLALVELRSIERFLAAHPELRTRLPGAAQGDLSRLRLVVNNKRVRVGPREHREHLPPSGPEAA
jgi:hypothetical protein